MMAELIEAIRPNVATLVIIASAVLICLLIRRLIFRHQAECWFCCQRVSVSYFKRNAFTCPHCEQYNGFTEDGDYNKPIPAMYNLFLNPTRPHTEVPGGEVPGRIHFLCATCQSNQTAKIQQLASFVPINEMTFEVEYREFSEQWDDLYKLCPPCLLRVNHEIERQDRVLAPNLHYYQAKRWQEEKNARNWWRRWLYNLFRILIRLGTVGATICLCVPDILVLLGTEKIHHLELVKHYDRQSLAITALSLLALSLLLSGRKRLKRIDGLFLVMLMLVSVSPRMTGLKGLWNSALMLQSQHLLAPLCLATSIWWFAAPYLRSLFPKKTKRATTTRTPQTDLAQQQDLAPPQDVPENYEGSSADEGGEIQEGPTTSGMQAGPSHVQRPVHNGIDSLTLGPPGNTQRKKNDVWTSHTCIGSDTPPPPEVDGSRPVVHPARFSYAGGSVPGSAASSTVDGPTNPGPANRAAQEGPRERQAVQRQVRHQQTEGTDIYGGATTSISESSDEGFSSISQGSDPRARRKKRRRRQRRINSGRRFVQSVGSLFKSLVMPVVFGISIGLNLSAALYLSYKDT